MIGLAFTLIELALGILAVAFGVVAFPHARMALRRRSQLAEAEHNLRISALRAAETRQIDRQLQLTAGRSIT